MILFSVGLGGYQFATGSRFVGACFLAAAALLIYGYFRYGTVWLAYRALRTGRPERARTLLDQIAFPDRLRSSDRAYYEMLRGMLAGEREEWATARDHFQRALEHDLRTSNDRCIVECALAEALLGCGETVAAGEHLELARTHRHKPELTVGIRKLEEMIQRGGNVE